MTTNTATTNRNLDTRTAILHLSPARFELGIRNYKTSGTALWFQIGMGRSTSWVEITLNAADLYDAVIFQTRGTKRTELARIGDAFGSDLAPYLVAAWCGVCESKGW